MGQYDSMKFWKQTIARTFKMYQMCNRPINIGDTYSGLGWTDSED